jgi:AbrB family looped-hinge helix DNA binding protein
MLFRNKIYGSSTVGARGQVVIPAELRVKLNIKPNEKLMVMANENRRTVTFIPLGELNKMLEQTSEILNNLEKSVPKEIKVKRK